MARLLTAASSEYYSAPITAGGLTYPFTLCTWFRLATVAATQYLISVNNSANSNNIIAHAFDVATGKYSGIVSNTAGGFNVLACGSGIAADTWYCGVFVGRSSVSRSAYLNNLASVANEATAEAISGLQNRILLGSYDATQAYVNGVIGHNAIWNAALTDPEVADLMNGKPPNEVRFNSLLAHWPMDDGGRAAGNISAYRGMHAIPFGAPKAYTDVPFVKKKIDRSYLAMLEKAAAAGTAFPEGWQGSFGSAPRQRTILSNFSEFPSMPRIVAPLIDDRFGGLAGPPVRRFVPGFSEWPVALPVAPPTFVDGGFKPFDPPPPRLIPPGPFNGIIVPVTQVVVTYPEGWSGFFDQPSRPAFKQARFGEYVLPPAATPQGWGGFSDQPSRAAFKQARFGEYVVPSVSAPQGWDRQFDLLARKPFRPVEFGNPAPVVARPLSFGWAKDFDRPVGKVSRPAAFTDQIVPVAQVVVTYKEGWQRTFDQPKPAKRPAGFQDQIVPVAQAIITYKEGWYCNFDRSPRIPFMAATLSQFPFLPPTGSTAQAGHGPYYEPDGDNDYYGPRPAKAPKRKVKKTAPVAEVIFPKAPAGPPPLPPFANLNRTPSLPVQFSRPPEPNVGYANPRQVAAEIFAARQRQAKQREEQDHADALAAIARIKG